MQSNHSCVFQSQSRFSLCLARQELGLDSSVWLACSKRDLLDMWLLPMGMASPWLDREMHPRSRFYSWLYIFRASKKKEPANLPHLKTRWARSVFHWYDYLAAVFVPSLGTTDVMLRVDALTNFTQQALQDSQKVLKVFQLLMLNKHKLERWFYKTDWL